MDEVELLILGTIFALSLAVNAARTRVGTARIVMDLSVILAGALALYFLKLSIQQDATDFLAADAGVILIVGAFGIGGLLPPGSLYKD